MGYAEEKKKRKRCHLKSKSKIFGTDIMFLFLILLSVQTPKDSELFGFDFDADAILLSLFHENGGLDRLNWTSLLIKPISTVIKDKCIASYQEAGDYNGELFECGPCGVRTYSQNNYFTFRVDDPCCSVSY